MPEVYNWQLGRKMLYPYEERHPKWRLPLSSTSIAVWPVRPAAWPISQPGFSRKARNMWWNNVETKPYGGYPQFYDVKITQLIEQVNPGGQVWNVRVGRKHHAPYGVFEG